MTGNLLTETPPPGWEGCDHLDCLPECKPWDPHFHCERLARLIPWSGSKIDEIVEAALLNLKS